MIKKRLLQLLSGAGKYIVFQVLFSWISLLCQIVLIFTAAKLLSGLFNGGLSRAFLVESALKIACCILLRLLCEFSSARASYAAGVKVKSILRREIYAKLLRLGMSYREQTSTAALVQMAVEGVEQLEIYYGKYLAQLFYSLLAPLTLFAVLVRCSAPAAVVLLIFVPLIPVSIVVVQKIAKRLLSKYWSAYTGLGDSFLENLQGLTTLKIYAADEEKAAEMDEEAEQFRRITMKVLTMQLNSTSVMDIVAYGGAALGIVVALHQLAAGALDLAGAITMLLLAAEFFLPLRLLGSYFHIAMNGMAASDTMFAFLDLPEDTSEKRKDVPAKEGVSVNLKNVSFAYEEARTILEDITIQAAPGAMTALVGVSGCGKSTIAGLLGGKNKGYAGSISLSWEKEAEVELQDLCPETLHRLVTLVSCNSYLFAGTVEENLRLAKPDAAVEELTEVLRLVRLWDFLQTQQVLETKVLERGSNFSGGQCQRLAIARALLADTPIYIFDEATSNIDAESEEWIMEVVRALAKKKTVLLISHRLANVREAAQIYMLREGRIAEAGAHEALLLKDGAYAALYRTQQALEQYAKGVGEDEQ